MSFDPLKDVMDARESHLEWEERTPPQRHFEKLVELERGRRENLARRREALAKPRPSGDDAGRLRRHEENYQYPLADLARIKRRRQAQKQMQRRRGTGVE